VGTRNRSKLATDQDYNGSNITLVLEYIHASLITQADRPTDGTPTNRPINLLHSAIPTSLCHHYKMGNSDVSFTFVRNCDFSCCSSVCKAMIVRSSCSRRAVHAGWQLMA